ncbi:MAG TPA: Nramp family divalent metal transporter [Armatimonadota bacterium]|nr:Nramp family divalent metal transporter [Armatimonadota bacterium]
MTRGVTEHRRRWLRRPTWAGLIAFLAIVGPGIITANVDNDAGGIATYSLAGAQYGYALLWSLVPITFALIVVQEMCARMGAVTGKGLADLIRENFGVKLTFFLMLGLLVANLANTTAEFSGLAASGEIFGVSKYLAVPLGALFVWWLVVKGSYRQVEKVFLLACLFYVSYFLSGILARPDWGQVLHHTVTPTLSLRPAFVTMLIGVVGTTIAPWMQFYLQSAVVDKGVSARDYGYCRIDVITGCIVAVIVAGFILLTTGATLYANHIPIRTVEDAALALQPLAGRYCSQLFAFGLLNASLFAASILPLATAYSVCEGMGWERGVNQSLREAPQFYGLYTGLIVIGAGLVLLPRAPLLHIMYLSQVANGILLPFVLLFMLVLINNPALMGPYRNSRAFNFIAWATAVIVIALTLALVVTTFLG